MTEKHKQESDSYWVHGKWTDLDDAIFEDDKIIFRIISVDYSSPRKIGSGLFNFSRLFPVKEDFLVFENVKDYKIIQNESLGPYALEAIRVHDDKLVLEASCVARIEIATANGLDDCEIIKKNKVLKYVKKGVLTYFGAEYGKYPLLEGRVVDVEENQVRKKAITSLLESFKDLDQFDTKNDYIALVQYGGGVSECYLEGTQKSLLLFALDVLNDATGMENDFNVLGNFGGSSNIGIDYIKVVDEAPPEELERRPRQWQLFALGLMAIMFVFVAFVGLGTIIHWLMV